MANNNAVFIFVKAPEPGRVKTRLAADIGDSAAAEFAQLQYQLMFDRFIENYHVEIWVDGNIHHQAFAYAHQCDVPIHKQSGCNLGQKMDNAMRYGLTKYSRVAVVGSDCNGVNTQSIEDVFVSLNHCDNVFIPALDGGFVVWAAKHVSANIFSGVAWGGQLVWLQTQQQLQCFSINYRILAPSWDIDSLDDLQQYKASLPALFDPFFARYKL